MFGVLAVISDLQLLKEEVDCDTITFPNEIHSESQHSK